MKQDTFIQGYSKDEIYRDQAMFQQRWPILNFYTPDGIRKLDSQFMHRILAFKRGEEYVQYCNDYSTKPPTKEIDWKWKDTFKSLRDDIINNPHLHTVIKKNLIFNLRNKND